MRSLLTLACLVALGAPGLRSQGPPVPFTYRGFALAAPYAEFTTRARSLTDSTAPLLCDTSRRTAQLMECGVPILDPDDGADFYVAAYVLEGRVAFLSFGDSGGVSLVERLQRELEGRFGPPHARRAGMWEWRTESEVARLTWRARGSARWVYIALWDEPLMNRISKYVPRKGR